MTIEAVLSWAHELDVIVDVVLDILDVLVERTLVGVSLPHKPLTSRVSVVFAGLLASRGGIDARSISDDIASPKIAVDVNIAHKALVGNMRPDDLFEVLAAIAEARLPSILIS